MTEALQNAKHQAEEQFDAWMQKYDNPFKSSQKESVRRFIIGTMARVLAHDNTTGAWMVNIDEEERIAMHLADQRYDAFRMAVLEYLNKKKQKKPATQKPDSDS